MNNFNFKKEYYDFMSNANLDFEEGNDQCERLTAELYQLT